MCSLLLSSKFFVNWKFCSTAIRYHLSCFFQEIFRRISFIKQRKMLSARRQGDFVYRIFLLSERVNLCWKDVVWPEKNLFFCKMTGYILHSGWGNFKKCKKKLKNFKEIFNFKIYFVIYYRQNWWVWKMRQKHSEKFLSVFGDKEKLSKMSVWKCEKRCYTICCARTSKNLPDKHSQSQDCLSEE